MTILPCLSNAQEKEQDVCVPVKISVERLPDMNLPRSGHSALSINDEIVVFGGHTTGFVPTPTAEYYRDGKWYLMDMVYEHDNGIATILKSGKVLLAGGHEKALGIGQTYPAELYDPKTHSFDGFGCLDKKRALANAAEIGNGNIVIAGNWYNGDEIELFDRKSQFSLLKEPSQHRSAPYILRTDIDDAVIFGPVDTCGLLYDSIIIDRVKGQPFVEPLFEKWKPLAFSQPVILDNFFIGDEDNGDFSYIIPVKGPSGYVDFMKVSGMDFSLIPTTTKIPKYFKGDTIFYHNLIVNKTDKKAYLIGGDLKHRRFFACLEYAFNDNLGKVPVTFYYTDPLPDFALYYSQICFFEGNILIMGGIYDSNFRPFASCYLFVLNEKSTINNASRNVWCITLALVGLVFCLFGAFGIYKKYFKKSLKTDNNPNENNLDNVQEHAPDALFEKICNMMKEKQLFLNPNIKLNDISVLLSTNSRYVSASINNNVGLSFPQFVNRYRVDYAKRILQKQPDIKLSSLCLEAGFSNEVSFFRSFKAHTNMTPKEWIDKYVAHE